MGEKKRNLGKFLGMLELFIFYFYFILIFFRNFLKIHLHSKIWKQHVQSTEQPSLKIIPSFSVWCGWMTKAQNETGRESIP